MNLIPAFDRSMRHTDADGRLHVEKTVISIANVCPYYGREITNWESLGLDPDRVYNLYRDADELRKGASTYHNVPLLEKHIAISAEQPKKDLWVGTVSDISFENPYLYGSLAVWDRKGIDLIESGAQEQLSAGYYFTAIMSPGVAPDGKRFDGRMVNLICNHVALVPEGRVGPESTIADESIRMKPMPTKYTALAKFLKDDADVAVFDQALKTLFDETTAANDAEKEKAEDAAHDFYGHAKDEWESMSAEDKAKARDEWEDDDDDEEKKKKKAGDRRRAKDGKVDHRDDFAGSKDQMITKDQLDAAVKAAGDAAAIAATARINALHAAREAVKPIVGVVAFDSADEVYAFALKHAGIKIDGMHPSAYPALIGVIKERSPIKAQPAFDAAAAAHSVSGIWH